MCMHVCIPVSMLPMMMPSPNLAFRQDAPRETPSGPESPRNCHDRVVCSCCCALFGNTDTTSGSPACESESSKTSRTTFHYIKVGTVLN